MHIRRENSGLSGKELIGDFDSYNSLNNSLFSCVILLFFFFYLFFLGGGGVLHPHFLYPFYSVVRGSIAELKFHWEH